MRKEFSVESGEDFAAVEACVRDLLGCEPRGSGGFLRSEAFLRLRMCAVYRKSACEFPVTAWLHAKGMRVSLEARGRVLVVDEDGHMDITCNDQIAKNGRA